MKLTFDGNVTLHMEVTPQERLRNIPLIYGAKVNQTTGIWYTSIKSLLPILIIFDEVIPTDFKTKALMDKARDIMQRLDEQKKSLQLHQDIKNKDYPFLMKHQALCNEIAKTRKRFAFFLDTGTRQNYNSIIYCR